MMAASSATVTVPAEEPNRITEVKTNVSDTETVAGNDGRDTVADPLRRVNSQDCPVPADVTCRQVKGRLAHHRCPGDDNYRYVQLRRTGRLRNVLRVIKPKGHGITPMASDWVVLVIRQSVQTIIRISCSLLWIVAS